MGLIKWWKDQRRKSRELDEKYRQAYERIWKAKTYQEMQIRLDAWDYAHRVTRDWDYSRYGYYC